MATHFVFTIVTEIIPFLLIIILLTRSALVDAYDADQCAPALSEVLEDRDVITSRPSETGRNKGQGQETKMKRYF